MVTGIETMITRMAMQEKVLKCMAEDKTCLSLRVRQPQEDHQREAKEDNLVATSKRRRR